MTLMELGLNEYIFLLFGEEVNWFVSFYFFFVTIIFVLFLFHSKWLVFLYTSSSCFKLFFKTQSINQQLHIQCSS